MTVCSCHQHRGNPGGASVWYTWQNPGGGSVEFNTCGSPLSVVIAVYTGGALDSLNPVFLGTAACPLGQPGARVFFDVPAASQTYRIAVDGVNSGAGAAMGAFTLNWQ